MFNISKYFLSQTKNKEYILQKTLRYHSLNTKIDINKLRNSNMNIIGLEYHKDLLYKHIIGGISFKLKNNNFLYSNIHDLEYIKNVENKDITYKDSIYNLNYNNIHIIDCLHYIMHNISCEYEYSYYAPQDIVERYFIQTETGNRWTFKKLLYFIESTYYELEKKQEEEYLQEKSEKKSEECIITKMFDKVEPVKFIEMQVGTYIKRIKLEDNLELKYEDIVFRPTYIPIKYELPCYELHKKIKKDFIVYK